MGPRRTVEGCGEGVCHNYGRCFFLLVQIENNKIVLDGIVLGKRVIFTWN